jgi:hypothetical protein
VAPAALIRGRLFSAGAIALALTLWSAMKQSAAQVRRQVSPDVVHGTAASGSWHTLRRWARAVREGALFSSIRPCPPQWPLRKVAEHVAHALASMGPHAVTGAALAERAFTGAAGA